MTKLIETADLETNFYTYEGVVKALDKVCLEVGYGITFGLVGESGCGKSVTVRSMMRIIQEPGRVDGGSIRFFPETDGPSEATDLLKLPEDHMRQVRGESISMIFQEPNAALNPIMSIGDQVAESFLFHRKQEMGRKILTDLESPDCPCIPPFKSLLKEIYRQAAKNPDVWYLKILSRIPILKLWERPLRKEALQRSIAIIEKLGIPNAAEVVKRYPHHLSGGMKQRIVIAIALACNPVLLIGSATMFLISIRGFKEVVGS